MKYNELYHHGIKGMKWGVRRDKKKLTQKVNKTHKLADDTERYIGRANAALQSSKGHQLLSAKAKNDGNKRAQRKHDSIAKKHLAEYELYDQKSKKAMGDFLKSKASALYSSSKVDNGRKYVDSLAGLTVDLERVGRYESKYKQNRRYTEGSEAERVHTEQLRTKYRNKK